jgi:hypothetical protein
MKLLFTAEARIVPVTAPTPCCGIYPASYSKVGGGWDGSFAEGKTTGARNGLLSRNGQVKNAWRYSISASYVFMA